jgi:hypothetical protein
LRLDPFPSSPKHPARAGPDLLAAALEHDEADDQKRVENDRLEHQRRDRFGRNAEQIAIDREDEIMEVAAENAEAEVHVVIGQAVPAAEQARWA